MKEEKPEEIKAEDDKDIRIRSLEEDNINYEKENKKLLEDLKNLQKEKNKIDKELKESKIIIDNFKIYMIIGNKNVFTWIIDIIDYFSKFM